MSICVEANLLEQMELLKSSFPCPTSTSVECESAVSGLFLWLFGVVFQVLLSLLMFSFGTVVSPEDIFLCTLPEAIS